MHRRSTGKKSGISFGFTALGASVYGAAFLTGLTGNLWIGIQIQLTGVLLLGILLFHRKIGSLLLDLFVKHPFDSFHRSGDFSGELPACTGGV